MAERLAAHGVRAGDRVAFYLTNGPETVCLLFGAWKLGAVPVTISSLYNATELAESVTKTDPVLVLTDTRRITDVCDLPLLVDIDTGFGASAFNIERTIKSLIKAGAAACHLEDQVGAKRCGHRPGKEIVSQAEMVDRVKAAADARTDPDFFLIARTDAIQVDGVDAAIERAIACAEAGADAIFAEAAYDLPTYQKFVDALKVPVLANITEFGATPLFTREELASVGVSIQLYPLSAFRAANKAAEAVYTAVRRDGHQKNVIDTMQTRAELYEAIGYHAFENKLDALFASKKK